MSDLSEFRANKPFTSEDVAEVGRVISEAVIHGEYDPQSPDDLAHLIETSEEASGLVRDIFATLRDDDQVDPEFIAALGPVHVLDLLCHVYRNVMTDEDRASKNIAGLLNVLVILTTTLAAEEQDAEEA